MSGLAMGEHSDRLAIIVAAVVAAVVIVAGAVLLLLRSGSSEQDTAAEALEESVPDEPAAPTEASNDESAEGAGSSETIDPASNAADTETSTSVSAPVSRSTSSTAVESSGSITARETTGTATGVESSTTTERLTTTTTGETSTTIETTTTAEAPGDSGISYPNPAIGPGPAGDGCDPVSGPVPDGLWFGRIQRAPDAPADGFWGDDKIEFRVYCIYGGDAAVLLAGIRLDQMRSDYLAVTDDSVRRTVARSDDATARQLFALTGAAGPAVPWEQGLEQFGSITGSGCCTEGWVRIQGGVVVEIAVIQEGGFTKSFPRPRDVQCADNGLDVNPLIMLVDSLPDGADGYPLYTGPGYRFDLVGSAPTGAIMNVVHRCEVAADGLWWWMLDWDGRAVWGPGNFLVPRD